MTSATSTVQFGGYGQQKCLNTNYQGWRCDRVPGHRGEHIALGELGTVYRRWRGGRARG